MTDCARGCTWPAPDADEPEPKRAQFGWLCGTCHRRLVRWLTDPHDGLVWAHDWIGQNLGGLRGVSYEGTQPGRGSSHETPIPLSIERLDVQRRIEDHVRGWEQVYRGEFGQQVHAKFDLQWAVMFLGNWIERIEDGPVDPLVAMWDELAQDMIDAHLTTPWRPSPRHIDGVPCPSCERADLNRWPPREAGDEAWIECMSCRLVMADAELARWESVCATDAEIRGAA